MDDRITALREEYESEGLRRAMLDADPIRQFDTWFQAALDGGVAQANAMVLATATPDGRPSARAVLLKAFDDRGFVFYTNLTSRKGRELAGNPRAALCLVWQQLHRQVRIEGATEVVSGAEADAYFVSRPYEAQLAAAASPQSSPVASRAELETRLEQFRARYPRPPVPRPPTWTGVRVVPDAIEFWQGRQFRLHDRFLYRRTAGGWDVQRLAP